MYLHPPHIFQYPVRSCPHFPVSGFRHFRFPVCSLLNCLPVQDFLCCLFYFLLMMKYEACNLRLLSYSPNLSLGYVVQRQHPFHLLTMEVQMKINTLCLFLSQLSPFRLSVQLYLLYFQYKFYRKFYSLFLSKLSGDHFLLQQKTIQP